MRGTTVFVIDDDADVREFMRRLISSAELSVATYTNAEEFLADHDPARPGCVVLDVALPGMSEFETQSRLSACKPSLPVIMTGLRADVSTAVRALKQGALDFIEKPVEQRYLLDQVRKALECDARNRSEYYCRCGIMQRVESLTPREREVLGMVVAGAANKNIAVALGRSQKTVEIHRANMMKKMGARSLAELVGIVHDAGLADGGLTSPAYQLRQGVPGSPVGDDGPGGVGAVPAGGTKHARPSIMKRPGERATRRHAR